jgi:hypothetical protein
VKSKQARQPEHGRVERGVPIEGELGEDLADHAAEFEAVTGEAGGEDDLRMFGMVVEDEVLVR